MSYDELMSDVIDIKDIGSGVVGAVDATIWAFRKKEVDFQIWIAQGDKPYPCRFSITSRMVPGSPQYSIQLRDWETGSWIYIERALNSNPMIVDHLAGIPAH